MSPDCEVHVRFFPPPPDLRRYFTTFYLLECEVADGGEVSDYLLPEWANLRFHTGGTPEAESLSGAKLAGTAFPVTGPISRAVRFTIASTRMWGIGLLPLGWAKFVGTTAAEFADGLLDGNLHPAFAEFRPLARTATCPVAAVRHSSLPVYGLQFHPEVTHTPAGGVMLRNFLTQASCMP